MTHFILLKRCLAALSVASLALFATACGENKLADAVKNIAVAQVDTTSYARRTIKTNAFTSVEVDCFADVTFHQTQLGEAPRVELVAPQEVLEHLTVKTTGGNLVVRIDRHYSMPGKTVAVVNIYAPFVSSFSLNGGKCLRLGEVQLSSPLTLSINGVGALTAERLVTPELKTTLKGAGYVELKGIRAERLAASLEGAGEILLSGGCGNAELELYGAGNIDVSNLRITGTVKRTASGVGSITR